jgi:hypothetical protein
MEEGIEEEHAPFINKEDIEEKINFVKEEVEETKPFIEDELIKAVKDLPIEKKTMDVFDFVLKGVRSKTMLDEEIGEGRHDHDRHLLEFYRENKKKYPFSRDMREMQEFSYTLDKRCYADYLRGDTRVLDTIGVSFCPGHHRFFACSSIEKSISVQKRWWIGMQVGGSYVRFKKRFKLEHYNEVGKVNLHQRPFSKNSDIAYLIPTTELVLAGDRDKNTVLPLLAMIDQNLRFIEMLMIEHLNPRSWLSQLTLLNIRQIFNYLDFKI